MGYQNHTLPEDRQYSVVKAQSNGALIMSPTGPKKLAGVPFGVAYRLVLPPAQQGLAFLGLPDQAAILGVRQDQSDH